MHRDAMRDPAVFDAEMQHIFEGSWVFVGLACQAPKPNDFFTAFVGRAPVVVSRDRTGALHCFLNSCRHRGATVFNATQGNRRYHACPYHGWVYDSGGKCVDIKDRDAGSYAPAFDCDNHDLVPVARFGNYRGFLFASLAPDVPALEEHLDGAARFLDLVVDQGPDGIEVIPGAVSYEYAGNWKMQLENALDLYHFTSTHPSYIDVLHKRGERRAAGAAEVPGSIYEDLASQQQSGRGTLSFRHGHVAYWGDNPKGSERPLACAFDEIQSRVGETAAQWMLKVRNLVVFPNLQVVENASLQLRVLRPVAVDRTEVLTWCIGPRGEPLEQRRRRIRQYEDFYNPSGMATPDDTAVYEACQRGHAAHVIEWQQGYSRGMTARGNTTSPQAQALGVQAVDAVQGSYSQGDETCLHTGYREWQRLLRKGAGAAAGDAA
ncbi:MAG: SRPBCC family protein [Burkholderiaceae bacterium]